MPAFGAQVHFGTVAVDCDLCVELVFGLVVWRGRYVFDETIYGALPKNILENLGRFMDWMLVPDFCSPAGSKAILGCCHTCFGYFASCSGNLALPIY